MEPSAETQQAEIDERERRTARALVTLIGIAMILTLALPVAIGIASYWLLGHYDVVSGMLRLLVSVGAGLLGVFLLNLLVMIPLTAVAATQSRRLEAAYQGEGADDTEARKLIQTLASHDGNDAVPPKMSEHTHTPASPPPSTSVSDAHSASTTSIPSDAKSSEAPSPPNDADRA